MKLAPLVTNSTRFVPGKMGGGPPGGRSAPFRAPPVLAPLFSHLAGEDGRRTPGRQFVPFRAPHGLAALRIQRGEEGSLLLIALDNHKILVEDGRTGRAPLELGRIVSPDVEPAEVTLPQPMAGEVVGIQALRPEECNDDAAIGRRGGVRISGLDVALFFGNALVRGSLPEDPARGAVQAQHVPLVHREIVRGSALPVEPGFEGGIGLAAHGGGEEYLAAPDDRAGVGQSVDLRFPKHAGVLPGVPLDRQVLAIGHSRRSWSAERRPFLRGGGHHQSEQRDAHQTSYWNPLYSSFSRSSTLRWQIAKIPAARIVRN